MGFITFFFLPISNLFSMIIIYPIPCSLMLEVPPSMYKTKFCFTYLYQYKDSFNTVQKIHKDKNAEPLNLRRMLPRSLLLLSVSVFLLKVCFIMICILLTCIQAFFDLENTNQEIQSDLKDLYINNASQVLLGCVFLHNFALLPSVGPTPFVKYAIIPFVNVLQAN